MDEQNSPGQIYALIPKIMAEVGAIEKTRRNQQQGYAFRGVDDVYAAFQKPLATHGVFCVPEVLNRQQVERQTQKGGTLFYTTLTVAYTLFAPDGSAIRAVVVGEAMDSGDKSSNKAMSAALKYALFQIFCIPAEATEDADAQSHEVKPKKVETEAVEMDDLSREVLAASHALGYPSDRLDMWVKKQFDGTEPWTARPADQRQWLLDGMKKMADKLAAEKSVA